MYKVLPSYTNFPASEVKERLLVVCKDQINVKRVSLAQYPPEVKRIYRSMWYRYVMHWLAEEWFEQVDRFDEFEEVFSKLIQNDWSYACIEACMYAWLCIDKEETLKQLFPNDKILPADLSYGLVLSYYEPVMRMACFLTRCTYAEERENLSEDVLKEAHDYALSNTLSKLKTLKSEAEVRAAVQTLKM